jgi:hypothetical protein
VTGSAGAWTVAHHEDPVVCGRCAITRWLWILKLVVTRPSNCDVAQALKRAKAPLPSVEAVGRLRRTGGDGTPAG